MQLTLLAAQSLDGFITRQGIPGSDFTSNADKIHFSNALKGFDSWIMGSRTYRQSRDRIRAGLTVSRARRVLTRQPQDFAADVVPGALEFTADQPEKILRDLAARGCLRCALLGGAQVYGLFLRDRLVDELWITVEPVLFGKGTPLLGGEETEIPLKLRAQESLSADTLLLKYEVTW